MKTEQRIQPSGCGTTGTAGIPAGENHPIPQHILDFCNRVYPPHCGSAYDGQRAHLIAKRMLIEHEASAKNSPATEPPSIPSMESILSILRSQPQPEQTRNTADTQPEQTRNDAETEAEQTRNETGINAEQQPKQNSEPTANPQSKHRGHESKIDALPPETRAYVTDLLEEYSLDKTRSILAMSREHPAAKNLTRACLNRYRQRLLREKARARAIETKEFVNRLLNDPHTPEDQLTAAIRHIFHTRLLETIVDPACALEDTVKAIQTSERIRQAEKRQKPAS